MKRLKDLVTAVEKRRAGRSAAIIQCLADHYPHVVAPEVLIARAWGDNPPATPAGLHVQIKHLRRVLPAGAEIDTVRGGYRLVVTDAAAIGATS